MTACVNNEKEIKGGVSHKVLRSVVAGVLAVSMVPTAAFAAPAADSEPASYASARSFGGTFTVSGDPGVYTGTNSTITVAIEDGSFTSGNTLFLVKDGAQVTEAGSIDLNTHSTGDSFTSTVLDPGLYQVVYSENDSYSAGDDTQVAASFKVLAQAPANEGDNWNASRFDYSVDPALDGTYTTQVGSLMTVDGVYYVTDPATPLNANDYSVFYADMLSGDLVADTDAVDRRLGGVPDAVGDYAIVVVQGRVDTAGFAAYNSNAGVNTLADLCGYVADDGQSFHIDRFSIERAIKDFGAVTAYEAGSSVDDTGIVYNGGTVTIGLAMDGRKVADGVFGSVSLVSQPAGYSGGVTLTATSDGLEAIQLTSAPAGSYTVRLTGADGSGYDDKTVDVSFTVQKLDLSASLVTASPIAADNSKTVSSRVLTSATGDFEADGTAIDVANYTATLVAVNGDRSAAALDAVADLGTPGVYTFALQAPSNNDNVEGQATVDVAVVSDLSSFTAPDSNGSSVVEYAYSNAAFPSEFKPFANYPFDPSRITGSVDVATDTANTYATTVVPFDYAVYKDGQRVESYDEPGNYLLEVWTDWTEYTVGGNDYSYAGHEVIPFTVLGETVDLSGATVYASYEGKEIPAGGIEYTGSAIVPAISVVYRGEALTAGEDYTVSYEDADGNAVESIVEPGRYNVVVTLNDTAETRKTVQIDVVKATIDSVEASTDFFPVGTEPAFTGYTEAGLKGQAFELAPEDVSVVYYAAEWDETSEAWDIDTSSALDASELEAGDYFADVQVKTTCRTLSGGVDNSSLDADNLAYVRVAETVEFSDVDADAWYATPVYKAKENGYMTGIAGTKLFMPEASITRAEMAAVMFNMAGQEGSAGVHYFPTAFSDVDGWAWYAEPVSWASQAGVMNGYAGTDVFGVSGKATREEVAAIFYNYAKAQGKDVTVEDADAALAAMADGETVSDWAKEAVAWAVENGVMGNAGSVWAQNPISRAEVAAMAVNFQPEALK